jgi:hypothetical protein
MRAVLERTGGFAGITIKTVADTSQLPDSEAQQLKQLVHDADFFALPETIVTKTLQPDRFEYVLTVEDGERSHTVTVGESAQPEAFRQLTDYIHRNLRPRKSRKASAPRQD